MSDLIIRLKKLKETVEWASSGVEAYESRSVVLEEIDEIIKSISPQELKETYGLEKRDV
jgi:hypothetical protein